MNIFKKICLMIMIVSTATANTISMNDFRQDQPTQVDSNRYPSSMSETKILSTTNLAWSTLTLLGATALTGREKKAHPVHTSLAGLSGISYGMFLNSYLNDQKAQENKYASYSKWLHIPAMIILPIAGSMALRDYDRGEKDAQGFAKLHKPAALASVLGMALATFSLQFNF